MFEGTPAELCARADTLTAQYLSGRRDVVAALRRRGPAEPGRAAAARPRRGAAQPARTSTSRCRCSRLVCVTGVSGSGKSTLVQDVLYAALLRAKGKPTETPGAHRSLHGAEHVGEVVMVDQTPIGRTTRSNPASYVGAFDVDPQALRRRGRRRSSAAIPSARFSFNSGNGRCPTCGGNGFEHVEMQFLSDVYLRCPDCDGRRYRPEILDVKMMRGDGTRAAASPTCST